MDPWIIAESDNIAACFSNSLRRLSIDCPPTRALKIDSIGHDAELIAGYAGVVFFAISNVEPVHIETIRRIRAVVDSDAMLVVVSAATPNNGTVLMAIRAGASDFLTADENLDQEIASFIARVRSVSKQKESLGRVFTIVPCQSASDANILAVNLAAVFAARLKSCGLLDFHFRGGDLALLLKITPRHTLVDLLRQSDTIDEAMFQQAFAPHETGIQLLAGPTSFQDLKNLRPHACQQIVGLAQRRWPVAIINAEDLQHADQIRALAAGDEVILTMRLDVVSLHHAQKHVEFLIQHRVSRDHIHVVAMGTGHSGELPVAAVKKVLHVPDLTCIPDDPVAKIRSINLGNPLVLERPNAKISQAITKFAESLIGHAEDTERESIVRPATAVKAAPDRAQHAAVLQVEFLRPTNRPEGNDDARNLEQNAAR